MQFQGLGTISSGLLHPRWRQWKRSSRGFSAGLQKPAGSFTVAILVNNRWAGLLYSQPELRPWNDHNSGIPCHTSRKSRRTCLKRSIWSGVCLTLGLYFILWYMKSPTMCLFVPQLLLLDPALSNQMYILGLWRFLSVLDIVTTSCCLATTLKLSAK